MMGRRAAVVLAGFVLASGALPALADRPPTAAERAAIEQVLRENGFQRWEEIEFDDGVWEVDDAVAVGGVEYDLKLDRQTYRIVRRERDD